MDKKQKIDCNVDSCMHNDISKCECRLNKIQVTPCKITSEKSPEAQTACSMYHYYGDLNKRAITNNMEEGD